MLNMHGYGFYVWSSYFSVIILLGIQWYVPWRRYHQYRNNLLKQGNKNG